MHVYHFTSTVPSFVVFCTSTILLFVLFSFRIVLQQIFSNIAAARQSLPELLFLAALTSSTSTGVIFPTLILLTSTGVIVPTLTSLNSTRVIVPVLISSTSTGVIFLFLYRQPLLELSFLVITSWCEKIALTEIDYLGAFTNNKD